VQVVVNPTTIRSWPDVIWNGRKCCELNQIIQTKPFFVSSQTIKLQARRYTLKKTEGIFKDRQSRDTGNIGHTRHGTQYNTETKKDEHHRPHKKTGVNPGDDEGKQFQLLIKHLTCYSLSQVKNKCCLWYIKHLCKIMWYKIFTKHRWKSKMMHQNKTY